jgi:hypothetical protein
MHADYADIRSRISEPPLWYDEAGVPRYASFTPHLAANIYAREAALVHTRCQACGAAFMVAMSWTDEPGVTLAEQIEANRLHPGDPPNIECCATGPSMSSVPVKVEEYWSRAVPADWKRDPSFERPLRPRWEN